MSSTRSSTSSDDARNETHHPLEHMHSHIGHDRFDRHLQLRRDLPLHPYLVFPKHADVEASGACHHIGHQRLVTAEVVDSTWLVVAVLESCSHHEQAV